MGIINSLVQFVTGTKALASEVNSNFETLRVANNNLDAEITTANSNITNIQSNYLKNDGSVKAIGLQSYATMPITGATNATPIVITSAAHNRSTGEQVCINGVLGNTAANGTYTITYIDANTFSLNGSTANGTYTSGGNAYLLPQNSQNLTPQIYVDNKVNSAFLPNFIDGFDITAVTTVLTGTISTTAGYTSVTGNGTLFTTEASGGSILLINGVSYTVASVTSNTALTLSTTAASSLSGVNYSSMTNGISLKSGTCADSTNTVKIVSPVITKSFNTTWSAGTGQGILCSGLVKSPNTLYYIFSIYNPTTQTADIIASTNLLMTPPTGYTYKRNIGSLSTDANGNINLSSIRYYTRLSDYYNNINNFSRATNGYEILASGLIIQWGKAAFGSTVTLPIAFPNNNINVSLTSEGAGLNYFGVLYMTKTSFYVTRGSFNDGNQINATGYVYWTAIGN